MIKGIGVSYRSGFSQNFDELLKYTDFVEVSYAGNLNYIRDEINLLKNKIPFVLHSIALSLGSVEPIPERKIKNLIETVQEINPEWISEHLSYSRNEKIEINNFIPLPYNDESIDIVSNNIIKIQELTGKKVAMENITHSFTWSVNKYTEAEFISRVLEKADCGLLLDATNLLINSKNLGYDPVEFLNNIPKDRVMQLHLAGHSEEQGILIDTHVGGIDSKVLGFAEWILDNTSCEAMVIERDSEFTSFLDVIEDIKLCRSLINKYKGVQL